MDENERLASWDCFWNRKQKTYFYQQKLHYCALSLNLAHMYLFTFYFSSRNEVAYPKRFLTGKKKLGDFQSFLEISKYEIRSKASSTPIIVRFKNIMSQKTLHWFKYTFIAALKSQRHADIHTYCKTNDLRDQKFADRCS